MIRSKKMLSLILIAALTVMILVMAAGCGKSEPAEEESAAVPAAEIRDAEEIGDGAASFYFIATDEDGDEDAFLVHTDEETVGEALEDAGLIETEERDYGMYVAEVNGVEANYTENGEYWALFIDGEYASDSIDSIAIDEDAVYLMRIEKAW